MMERTPETTRPAAYAADIEYLPRRELDLLQSDLLAKTITRAMGAPFFRERLAAWEVIPEQVSPQRFQETVPLTSKQDLREARESAWVVEMRDRITLMLGTSGTTGTRIPLPYTGNDLQRWWSLTARTMWANGLRPSDVTLLPVPVGLFTGGHAMLGGLMRLGCTVLPTGPVATAVLLDALRGGLGMTPTAIVTMPSHMLHLLDSLRTAGFDPALSPLRVGSFGAEAWSEAARRRIEDGFGLRAADSYGIGELCGPGVAAECELRAGMHVWEDAFFVEVVDPASGEPVADGVPGEMVLTSLFREVLPLLRFRTGDEVCLIPEPCACGRSHRRISRIARRLDAVLVVSGVNIDPVDIERILYAFPWVGNEFSLEASGEYRNTLLVHVERRPECPTPPEAEQQLIEAIRRFFPVRILVEIHAPGDIERGPGKARRIKGA